MKKFKIEKEHHGYKISEYLREIQNYSGRGLRNIEVFLDGKKVRTTQKIRKQGLLKVVEKEKGTNIKPIKIPLDIVFEDEAVKLISNISLGTSGISPTSLVLVSLFSFNNKSFFDILIHFLFVILFYINMLYYHFFLKLIL